MIKEVLDTTCMVYALGIQEGYRRAVGRMREDIIKRGKAEELYEIVEHFAKLLADE